MRRRVGEIRHCYELQLQGNPGLSGHVHVRFVIGGTGHVASAVAWSSDLRNTAVKQCIAGAVRRWVFPGTWRGGSAVVNYPLVLRPIADSRRTRARE